MATQRKQIVATIVPVSEVTKIVLQCLSSSGTLSDIVRSTLRILIEMAVKNFYFKSNGN